VAGGGTVTRCYSMGDIISSATTSSSSRAYPYSRSGGIAGVVQGGTITYSAAINASIAAGYAAGRIVGEIDSAVATNNLALDTMTATGSAGFDTNPPTHGSGMSDEAFKKRNTYEGTLRWSFGGSDAAPWQIEEDADYPTLYWQR